MVSGDPLFGVDKLYGVEAVRGSLFDDTYDATGFNSGNGLNTFFEGPFPSIDRQPVRRRCRQRHHHRQLPTQLDYRMAEAGITVTFTGHGAAR